MKGGEVGGTTLNILYTAIEDLLEAAKTVPETVLPGHFDSISDNFHQLHRLVADATLFLAGFEIKTAQEVHTYYLTLLLSPKW
jgi:hypothetical protein